MISAIIFKHSGAPGLRVFGDAIAAIQAGENPANLHSVAGLLLKWPQALGNPPDVATLNQWEAERVEAEDVEKKKALALEALEAKRLEDALNDPNAPQAVKDYKAVKKL